MTPVNPVNLVILSTLFLFTQAPDRIVFDGESLVWVSANGSTTYVASSGNADGTAAEASDGGPIPQGKYTLDPANIQDLTSQSPAVLREWGRARVVLQPWASTRRRMLSGLKLDARGFAIHGGSEKGAARTIELSDAEHRRFFSRLKAYGKPIDVEVRYRDDAAEAAPAKDDPGLTAWWSEFDSPWADPRHALVLDPYWMNDIDWNELATDERVAAIIHKATQGLNVDRLYAARREEARRRGYLWGSYHLAMPGDPIGQADCYLDTVRPEDSDVIALDLEGLDAKKFMSLDDARRFIERVRERTGRYPVLYANGAVVREIVKTYGPTSVFGKCPLWYAQPTPVINRFPNSVWKTYALWQFSTEQNCKPAGKGACLYRVNGTKFDMDVNVFFGTVDDLRSRWPFRE